MFKSKTVRSIILVTTMSVIGCGVWYAMSLRASNRIDPVAITANLRIIVADESSPEEIDQSVNRLILISHEQVVRLAVGELANLVRDEPSHDWIEHRQFKRAEEIPRPYRKQCLLWRVLTTHRRGGSTGLALQQLAKEPEHADIVWEVIRYLPDEPFDVAVVKMDLMHGLMEERRLLLHWAKNGIPHKGRPAVPPPENAELVLRAGQLVASIPAEEESHAYFFASQFGKYLGVDFSPMNTRDPQYQGPHGPNEKFFAEPAQRAKEWWRDNQGSYAQQRNQ